MTELQEQCAKLEEQVRERRSRIEARRQAYVVARQEGRETEGIGKQIVEDESLLPLDEQALIDTRAKVEQERAQVLQNGFAERRAAIPGERAALAKRAGKLNTSLVAAVQKVIDVANERIALTREDALLLVEDLVIAARSGTERGTCALPIVAPENDPALKEAIASLRTLATSDLVAGGLTPRRLPSEFSIEPHPSGVGVNVIGNPTGVWHLQGTSGAVLLRSASPWTRPAEDIAREQLAKNERARAAQEDARDNVDGWLRRLLTDSPRSLKSIEAAATRAGLALVADPAGADVNAARERLGVVEVWKLGAGRAPEYYSGRHWALPGYNPREYMDTSEKEAGTGLMETVTRA